MGATFPPRLSRCWIEWWSCAARRLAQHAGRTRVSRGRARSLTEGAAMTIRQLGGLLGVAGGAAWVIRWMLVSADSGAADMLRIAGLVLILLGLVCVGLTLVKGQALWLDVVVGFAAPALFWALYEVVNTEAGGSLAV